jgi:hypothetical protein
MIHVVLLVIVVLVMSLFVRVRDLPSIFMAFPFYDETYDVYDGVNCYQQH